MIFSISPNTCCFDADLFEHGLDHEVAVRIEALVGGNRHERAQLVRRVGVQTPLGLELADLLVI